MALMTRLSAFIQEAQYSRDTGAPKRDLQSGGFADADFQCNYAVAHEVKQWQNRSLDSVYAIVYFDAIVVKIRHEGKVSNRAIYLALGINLEGRKEILGMWSSPTEGAILAKCLNRA